MKNKTNIPNFYFSLIFPTLEKQIKMNLFALKTLLKTCIKTLEKKEILALQILVKTALEWGIYNPQENLPVSSWKGPECPSGRPAGRPANGQKSDH